MANQNLSPTTNGNDASGGGTVYWSFGGSTEADDDTYCTAAVLDAETSLYLTCTNAGFSIPLDSTITGVKVTVVRKASATGGSYADVSDAIVSLVKASVVGGSNLAAGGSWASTESTVEYGNSSEKWSLSISPADTNDTGFGVAIAVQGTGGSVAGTAMVDWVTITVYYLDSATGEEFSRAVTLRWSQHDEEEGKPRTVYAFAGDVILDPVVDDYYGGAVAILRPTRDDDGDFERRPLLSYVSASDFTEAAVFAWQPVCLVLSVAADDDDQPGGRSITVAPSLTIPYESDCACFGSVVKGLSGNGTVTKSEATDTQTPRNGSVVKGPSGSGTVSKPFCGC